MFSSVCLLVSVAMLLSVWRACHCVCIYMAKQRIQSQGWVWVSVQSGAVDWDVVDTISAEKLSEYMKYVSLIFWRHIDKRPNSVLSVVLDANGFSMGKVISGSARNVLSAIVNGLNETVDYVGYRPGTVFLINAPSFLSPLVKVVAKLSRVQVAFHVLSKPSKWQPVLKEHIGEENLPIEYGGSNKLPLDSSPVVTFIRASVKKIRQKKEAAAKSKL